MIKVLFFASYRERLGCSELLLDATADTVLGLKNELAERGEIWKNVLLDQKTLVAVNQAVGKESTLLSDGDEVAFFPPVTGG